MAEAVLITKKELGTNGLMKYDFDVAGLVTDTVSAEVTFDFNQSIFTIIGLNFACSATDVNVTFFDQSGVSTPSSHQIFHQSNVNQSYSNYDLGIPIYTDTESLYSIIRNNDASNHTGTISMAFLVR